MAWLETENLELILVDTKQQKIKVGIALYPLVLQSTIASFSAHLTGNADDDDGVSGFYG